MYGRGPGYGGPPGGYPPGMYPGSGGYPPSYYGGPPAGAPVPYAYSRPGGIPPKSTTVYVGKIPPTLSNEMLEDLLRACGDIQSWKPTIDPDKRTSKGFGFAAFVQAEGVIAALKLIHDLEVEGQKLIVKTNKATQEYIDWLENDKKRYGRVSDEEVEKERLETAMNRIREILGPRVGELNPVKAADDFLASLEPTLAPKLAPALEDSVPASRPTSGTESEPDEEDRSRVYAKMLQEWEHYERTKFRDQEREMERLSDAAKERARAVYSDVHQADNDIDLEPWKRKPFSTSQRGAERRRRREKEEADDRAAEEMEIRAREERQLASEAAPQEARQEAVLEEVETYAAGPHDAVDQAVLNASRDSMPVERRPAARKRVFTQTAFAAEEEEVASHRQLIPISYTDEELRAVEDASNSEDNKEQTMLQQPAPAPADPLAAAKQQNPPETSTNETVQDVESSKRKLMASVPKGQDDVFAWPIKWELLDQASEEAQQRIKGWVNKRIQALLGEEEETFVNFIMQQIGDHSGASEVLEALRDVLDEDAPAFVTKLYQVLIYESLKLEHHI